ncbi:MAG: hypothetical protein J6W96_05580 [Alphaproteobacteria bacterium]|nr:hypothetical protein [Alphaproteobacteria bacterium]
MDVREEMKEERKKHDTWLKKWFNVIWPFSKNKEMRKEINYAVAYCLAGERFKETEKIKRKLIKKYGVKGAYEILKKIIDIRYTDGIRDILGMENSKDDPQYLGSVVDRLLDKDLNAKEVVQKFKGLEFDEQTLPDYNEEEGARVAQKRERDAEEVVNAGIREIRDRNNFQY